MIVDLVKILVWLIERYNLREEVLQHLIDGGQIMTGDFDPYTKEEAVIVDTNQPYLLHFDEPVQTETDLKNKMVECTND